ncbi:deaminase [Streptomyces goshikiensis]|uniref:deaminase n=1 Tax=Streptomyces goshikiensis TaxID=1942 RepID=UPI003695354E
MVTPDGAEPAPSPVAFSPRLEISDEDVKNFLAKTTGVSRPDLVFSLVRTLGCNTAVVLQELEETLAASGYESNVVRLSSLLSPDRPPQHEPDRYELLMDAGDELRQLRERSDAVVIEGVRKIIELRNESDLAKAWIIDSVMHPEEVNTLRGIYGSRLFVIACDAPRNGRHEALKRKFRRRSGLSDAEADQAALHAINRDAGSAESKDPAKRVDREYRLSVGRTLERCDVFVRTDDPGQARDVVKRLVECVFGYPYHAPTLDELGMAVAFQAALTTATLSRRVGAAIMIDGQIVATGANEVPKSGGGTYNSESKPDGREFVEGFDPSDDIRAQILADLLMRLREERWLAKEYGDKTIKELTDEAINTPRLGGSELFDIIEYGRSTHAEMVAITGAAKLGISIAGGTLYTTTLPCHECTRNIIASGIQRVVYLEPYPKSRGAELQPDSMTLVAYHGSHSDKVDFEPFSGLSYRRFPEFFSWIHRKEDDIRREQGNRLTFTGEAVVWKAREANIRPSIFNPVFGQAELLTQRFREYSLVSNLPNGYADALGTETPES